MISTHRCSRSSVDMLHSDKTVTGDQAHSMYFLLVLKSQTPHTHQALQRLSEFQICLCCDVYFTLRCCYMLSTSDLPCTWGWRGCWWWTLAQLNSLLDHLCSGEQKAVQASAFSSLTASISSCSNEGGTCAPTVDDISALDLWRTPSQQVDNMLDTLDQRGIGSNPLVGHGFGFPLARHLICIAPFALFTYSH